MIRRASAAVLALLLGASAAMGYELQIRNAALSLGEVETGRAADVGAAASPMVIVNNGPEPITVSVSALVPAPEDEWMTRKGFEPVPDLSWIELPSEITVPAYGRAVLTGSVRVPAQRRWRGRRFQFDVLFTAEGPGTIALALKGAGRFEVKKK